MTYASYGMTPYIIRETSHGLDCVRIEDELLQSREIFLTDAVGPESMNALIKQLMYLHRADPDGEITVYINSPGGEVQSGLAVYDFLKLIHTPIRTVCLGLAASMGAILFLAGDRREMLPNARIMIHDPAPGGGSLEGMKPGEMEERLAELKKTQGVLCSIISEITGRPLEEVREKTRKDSYFSAKEAVEFGLATSVLTAV